MASKRVRISRRTPEENLRINLKRMYGLELEDYYSMRDEQGGLCAICLGECSSGWRLCVDHDHETGRIRGLLCRKCNLLLGYSNDSTDLLLAAAEYLEAT